MNSEEWRLLSNLDIIILMSTLNIMEEATRKYENEGGSYPTIEYAISLAIDRNKSEMKREEVKKGEELPDAEKVLSVAELRKIRLQWYKKLHPDKEITVITPPPPKKYPDKEVPIVRRGRLAKRRNKNL